jgi:hypothetical protein
VEAEYLFGAPVAAAQLRYRVYSSPDWSLRYGLLPRSAEEDYFATTWERSRATTAATASWWRKGKG